MSTPIFSKSRATSPWSQDGGPHGFACPECGATLQAISPHALLCACDGRSYRREEGVWQLLSAEDASKYSRFVDEYTCIRHREGRGGELPEYYRRLPFATGRYRYDWHVRAVSFRRFVRQVVAPLEPRRLRILDVGAGNGWLSYRMAKRGHEAYAVDLRTDGRDGLGAHVHYDAAFVPVQADFDRLPFRDEWFDVVVFNASFHYSTCYEHTLGEALRVLAPGGRVVVVDSPIYGRSVSGEKMVLARKNHFRQAYGFASDSIDSEEYLTPRRLRELSARLGVTWTCVEPWYGLRWMARRVVGRIRHGRESARFALLVGRAELEVDSYLREAWPNPVLRGVGRLALKVRFLARQRSRLARDVMETVRDIELRVPPDVFNPVLFRTGSFLAETVLEGAVDRGATVLDLGTGSGVCGIAAARAGADVIAVDVNPKALESARENGRRNDVALDVRPADLFDGVGAFDVVLFNPPYYPGRPETPFEQSWRSNDLVVRFAAELRSHLHPGGYALVVLSTDGSCPDYLRRFAAAGLRLAVVSERRFTNETLTIYRVA